MKTFSLLMPEALVMAAALACLLSQRLEVLRRLPHLPWFVVGLLVVALGVELTAGAQVTTLFHGGFGQDRFALFAKLLTLLVLLVVVAAGDWALLGTTALAATLVAGFGALVVASATGLAGTWTGLELSLLGGVVALSRRDPQRSRQLLLAAGSLDAVLLAGLGGLYALTGTTVLVGIQSGLLGSALTLPLVLSVLLVLAALTARLALAGSLGPLPATGAGLVLIKLAATLAPVAGAWKIYVPAIAALLMLAGALRVLAGGGPRSILAGAGLVQAGWLTAALAAPDRFGIAAALFLLGGYLLALAGAPLALGELPHGLAGLAERGVGRAAGYSLALLSMAGVPPLAGFFGIIAVASELARYGAFWLILVGVFSLAVVAQASVRDLRLVFLTSPGEALPRLPHPWLGFGGALAVGVLVVGYGLFANPISSLALQGATAIGLR